MPFDSLVLRAIEARWQPWLIGSTVIRAQSSQDRLLMTAKDQSGQTHQLLWVLKPGVQRLHRTTATSLPNKLSLAPWLQKILPFTVANIEVPLLERVMTLVIDSHNEWGVSKRFQLVIELAGHLTNLVLVDAQGAVVDAWHKISPGRPGRTIWPKHPYKSPPLPPGTKTGDGVSPPWPPWGQRWIEQGGDPSQLIAEWESGFSGPAYILTNRMAEEVWIKPMPGYTAQPTDIERALDIVYNRRELIQQEDALRHQLTSQLKSRLDHLSDKIGQHDLSQQEDAAHWKMIGDLWLTHQSTFKNEGHLALTVTGYDGQPVTLTRPDATSTPVDQAQDAYRRYKKLQARKEALARLIPLLQEERRQLENLMQAAHQPHPLEWYRAQLKKNGRPSSKGLVKEPYRHFKSLHGLDVWVGRNRDENARLTFQKARPDDIWLHAKQSPGSHVILGTGRINPDLQDLLDAAELAVFFSSASASSTVPVDYTRRKFVRKKPHAEPGQVLYQREKTLYITPDRERLQRLGAISEKLADE